MSEPPIAVIIFTHNRAEFLDVCLQSDLRQTLPRHQYDILKENGVVVYENFRLEYPFLWMGLESFPAEGRDKCAMYHT